MKDFLLTKSWILFMCITFPLLTGLDCFTWQLWVYTIPLAVLVTISMEYQKDKIREGKE
jgi:hypothetical protein